MPDDDPNAFATGRDAATASIAVTEGLLRTLSRDELQGVVAHEMAHVQNLDVRLMTLLAGMVGAIALMSDGMGRMMRGSRHVSGGGGRGGSSRGKGGGNPLALVVLVLWLLTLVVAPIVSRILAMAVSRKREYLADATGRPVHPQPAGARLGAGEARGRILARRGPSRAARRTSASSTRRRASSRRAKASSPTRSPPIRRSSSGSRGCTSMGYLQQPAVPAPLPPA